jgi:peptidoglycan/LPS O-acetylase OafA/YrhL
MKKEIRSLTGVRGIAALYVACYHFQGVFQLNPDPLFLGFIQRGYSSVDLFFILSGFVMALSSKKLFEEGVSGSAFMTFMKRRFARIYPVYIFFTILYFGYIFKLKGWAAFSINLLLLQVVVPHTEYIIGPSWSLSAEWLAYLCFPFLLLLVYKFRSNKWAIACLLMSFGILTFVSLNNSTAINGFEPLPSLGGPLDRFRGFSALLRCFSEYIIGIVLYKIYAEYYLKYSKYYHYAALPAALLILLFLFIPNTDVVIVFLFAVLIFSSSTDTGVVAKFLGSAPIYFLGEISYSLYVMHELVLRMIKYLYKHQLSGSHITIVSATIIVLLLLLLSYLSYRFIEIPSRDYLRKKLEDRPGGRAEKAAPLLTGS